MSVLLIALLPILMGSFQLWIQIGVGLLDGCALESLFLVFILLLSQRLFQKRCRLYVKTSVCNMSLPNVCETQILKLNVIGIVWMMVEFNASITQMHLLSDLLEFNFRLLQSSIMRAFKCIQLT